MKISTTRYAIDEILDTYRNLLDTIPDEQFDVTPADGHMPKYIRIYYRQPSAQLLLPSGVQTAPASQPKKASPGPAA
jgi:hypothetical protein